MQPADHVLKTSTVLLSRGFQDEQLKASALSRSLGFGIYDSRSVDKARVTALSLICFLSYRAVFESFIQQYRHHFPTAESMQKLIISGTTLFESIVESNRANANLPTYVDEAYFTTWRRRYEEAALQIPSPPLKEASIVTFMRQATFTYLDEPSVISTENNLWAFGTDVYDHYVTSFKDLVGDEVLNG